MMKKSAAHTIPIITMLMLTAAFSSHAQSKPVTRQTGSLDGTVISVTAWNEKDREERLRSEGMRLYENGIEQRIRNFAFDPSPARIVIVVDNSLTLRADLASLRNAVMEFAYEIYEGDQLYVVAYDEKPEIVHEWTDDADKIRESLSVFRKKGNPHMFDAISASAREILAPLMPGTRKTVIVVIGDGLDRGSKTSFGSLLGELQDKDITVYALQLPDRTGGAFRRNQPKAGAAVSGLTEGTGGRAYPFEDAQRAAKEICDELKKHRYLLSYSPTNTSSYDARRLFIVGEEGVTIRSKNANPPNLR
jgi:Ca-activated chloride channel family protein